MNLPIPILIDIANTFCTIPSYLYEDNVGDNLEELLLVFIEQILKEKIENNVPKIGGYVERIVPSLAAMEFKNHFR